MRHYHVDKRALTVCGFLSLCSALDSAGPLVTSWGEEKGGVGRKRCSKMAIIRNIDTKIAVATKPKEIAFMDVPKLFHGASLSITPVWDGAGSELVYMFHGFDLSEPSSFIVFWREIAGSNNSENYQINVDLKLIQTDSIVVSCLWSSCPSLSLRKKICKRKKKLILHILIIRERDNWDRGDVFPVLKW